VKAAQLQAQELETTCEPAKGSLLRGSSVPEMERLNLEKVVVDGNDPSVEVIREALRPDHDEPQRSRDL
jgi:hypothetical protein